MKISKEKFIQIRKVRTDWEWWGDHGTRRIMCIWNKWSHIFPEKHVSVLGVLLAPGMLAVPVAATWDIGNRHLFLEKGMCCSQTYLWTESGADFSSVCVRESPIDEAAWCKLHQQQIEVWGGNRFGVPKSAAITNTSLQPAASACHNYLLADNSPPYHAPCVLSSNPKAQEFLSHLWGRTLVNETGNHTHLGLMAAWEETGGW